MTSMQSLNLKLSTTVTFLSYFCICRCLNDSAGLCLGYTTSDSGCYHLITSTYLLDMNLNCYVIEILHKIGYGLVDISAVLYHELTLFSVAGVHQFPFSYTTCNFLIIFSVSVLHQFSANIISFSRIYILSARIINLLSCVLTRRRTRSSTRCICTSISSSICRMCRSCASFSLKI